MVDRRGLWAALCVVTLLGAGVAQAQPNPGQFGREHEHPRPAEPPRHQDMRTEMRPPQMRPQMPPPMRPEMRPAMAPFRQPAPPFYAPPPFRGPSPAYGRAFGSGVWSNDDGDPAAWDVRAAQDNFNQIIQELQQEHNDGVVQLQQQYNVGQISRQQMDYGIADLGRRYDDAVAYQQQLLFR